MNSGLHKKCGKRRSRSDQRCSSAALFPPFNARAQKIKAACQSPHQGSLAESKIYLLSPDSSDLTIFAVSSRDRSFILPQSDRYKAALLVPRLSSLPFPSSSSLVSPTSHTYPLSFLYSFVTVAHSSRLLYQSGLHLTYIASSTILPFSFNITNQPYLSPLTLAKCQARYDSIERAYIERNADINHSSRKSTPPPA
jgi:hypothetical protein